jgi:hypothetical protein
MIIVYIYILYMNVVINITIITITTMDDTVIYCNNQGYHG